MGYAFRKFSEGDLLSHVRANQSYYLGCVFSVIRAWHEAGKTRTDETRHDFRDWVQVLDWITTKIFSMAPIIEGHREAQERVSNPDLVFLRAIAIAYEQTGYLGEQQNATEIASVCESEGITIPGSKPFQDSDRLTRQIGICFGRLFKNSQSLNLEGYVVTREIVAVQREDGKGTKDSKSYRFEKINGAPCIQNKVLNGIQAERNVLSFLNCKQPLPAGAPIDAGGPPPPPTPPRLSKLMKMYTFLRIYRSLVGLVEQCGSSAETA